MGTQSLAGSVAGTGGRRTVPDARLVVIQGAGHGLIEEHAREVNLLLAGLLAEVAQT